LGQGNDLVDDRLRNSHAGGGPGANQLWPEADAMRSSRQGRHAAGRAQEHRPTTSPAAMISQPRGPNVRRVGRLPRGSKLPGKLSRRVSSTHLCVRVCVLCVSDLSGGRTGCGRRAGRAWGGACCGGWYSRTRPDGHSVSSATDPVIL
jgi:hypothetical protein